MPTLRERPSRGEISPAKKSSPTASKSTPRSHRSSMAGDAIEVRESIEAKVTSNNGDVEMKDADNAPRKVREDVDADADADADADVDADADADADADGESDEDMDDAQHDDSSPDILQLIKETSEYLCHYTVKVDGEDHEIASGFQRLVNKRSLPDYFEVIKEPMAFSTIRAKLGKKTYTGFNEFVNDVMRICHNAQVYNRPSAPIFSDAARLQEVFKENLNELVSKGDITAEEAALPDLGPLPEFEDSPPPEDEEEVDEDDEEEDEEEDEDEDDSDDEGGRRRARRRGRQSGAGRRDRGDDGDDPHKKRGRPPKVFTPLEGRIQALLKGLRKYKNDTGQLRVVHFEKLPDKAELPDYYTAIRNPVALDLIKKKHKRKKYQNVDQVLQDLELMFENAKEYNEEGSEVYEDAVELQKQARILTELEKAKPDDAFRDEDGKLPLASIEYRGESWKVGDWVHIRNANDLSKPIVAQIFRTWSDASGQKWVNACWYYRPEQTVHRFDKFFYENEVVKTGQYRDHRIEDVEDRCFVMFITRYPKGRPRGFPRDKAVYLCEARYNEEKYRFNKIKTWTSCLPDEVRERDYEMDLFDNARNLKKNPSPIKHLLQADAKETDEPPKPTWRSPNAPPLIGAVHRRPREPNESPPPEPHALPLPTAIAPVPLSIGPPHRGNHLKGDVGVSGTPGYHHPAVAAPAPAPSPSHYMQQFAPRQAPPPAAPAQLHLQPQPQPVPMQMHYGAQPQAPPPLHYQTPAHLAPAYDPHHRPVHPAPGMTPTRQTMPPTPSSAAMPHANPSTGNVYNVPRAPEVYTLADGLDTAIPTEVRDQFQRDEQGCVLFFTAPPLNRSTSGVAEQYAGLGHSVSHLANIKKLREERAKKRKERDDATAAEQAARKKQAAMSEATAQEQAEAEQQTKAQLMEKVILEWCAEIDRGTVMINDSLGDWKTLMRESRAENSGKTSTELRSKVLEWFYNDSLKRGAITAEQKKELEDCFIRHKYLEN
ncbi:hypothetical protein B0T26DRAFT_873826 [Lasiosphaeria miniovina]|uniref:Chromatin structure-remodeling complex subunit RSC1 n=1 Tax=Lasiosphaeria miniovina TaxID=1954250 RepID=A0AA40DSE7_9PEZI|nr:uncharacterized protein B0T26DRAFT_873826 [Lasiosphaeria miniovina]KAK0713780.1 hypothetical protein B0T26DRAFT_873826 [Lasiosphaeria miniovina]